EEIQGPSKENTAKMPRMFQKYGDIIGLKRMIRKAAEEGYGWFGMTTGETQADRYNLSKHVDVIKWEKRGDKYALDVKLKDGGNQEHLHTPNALSEFL